LYCVGLKSNLKVLEILRTKVVGYNLRIDINCVTKVVALNSKDDVSLPVILWRIKKVVAYKIRNDTLSLLWRPMEAFLNVGLDDLELVEEGVNTLLHICT
jgi:hypothetical protein